MMSANFPLSRKFAVGEAQIEVGATNNPALATALATGGSFPAGTGDVNLAGFGVGLPEAGKSVSVNTSLAPFRFQFSGGVSEGLGSFTTLPAAIAQVRLPSSLAVSDLLPGAPGSRYTVFSGSLEAAAGAGASIALAPAVTIPIGLKTTASARYAAIAEVDGALPIVQQLGAVFQGLALPQTIDSAADIHPNVAICCQLGGSLQASAGVNVGYNYNWVRQIAAGEIKGDLGLILNTKASATATFSLSGAFTMVLTRDGADAVRLRLFKNQDIGFNFAAQLDVDATPVTPELPATADEFISALMGIHQLQWLAAVKQNIVKVETIAADKLKQLFQLWDGLEAKAAAVIWDAAARQEEFALVQQWVHRIATDLNSQAALKTELDKALTQIPGFVDSPVARWIEALAGNLLGPLMNIAIFQRVAAEAKRADGILSSEQGLQDALRQLKELGIQKVGLANIEQALRSFTDYQKLDQWVRQQIEELLGKISSDSDLGKVRDKLQPLFAKRNEIYQKAVAALKRTYGASLSLNYQAADSSTALLDCSFRLDRPTGLETYRKAVLGDFKTILAGPVDGVTFRHAVLTHGLQRSTHVELHLPFLNPEEWSRRVEALGSVDIQDTDDGRVFAYTVKAQEQIARKDRYQCTLSLAGGIRTIQHHSDADFTLSYVEKLQFANAATAGVSARLAPVVKTYGLGGDSFHTWMTALAPRANVEASLTVAVPGTLVSAWLKAPAAESDAIYTQVALAVQDKLRLLLPLVYFSDLDRFGAPSVAYPLLAYAASIPAAHVTRERSYDVQDMTERRKALNSAAVAFGNQVKFAGQLEAVHSLLIQEGRSANFYHPARATVILGEISQQMTASQLDAFAKLLLSEAQFTRRLVNMGVKAAQVTRESATDPDKAVKDLTKFASEMVQEFQSQLESLYGGVAFKPFGALLLLEATNALTGASSGGPPPFEAMLRLKVGEVNQVFVTAPAIQAGQPA